MIGRKLSFAAKQLLSSSSIQTGLFHTNNTPEQALKRGLLSAQKKASANRSSGSAAGAPPATHKPPPRALIGAPETSNFQEPKDENRPLHRPWRSPRHVTEDDEDKKKKKKKRAPPGPIEFESLTSATPAHSNLPFAFRYSYTEIPKVPAVGFQEKYSPFGPGRLDRVWDGQQALLPSSSSPHSSAALSSSSTLSDNSVVNMKKSKYSFKGVRLINPPSVHLSCTRPKKVRSREQVLGEPLTPEETKILVENASKHKTRRQINMGRDGLTHNMLIEIQEHWKYEPVARIRCKGVCTVDMDNVHFQLEDKTGGKIIERVGGTLYLFRGRNFRFKDRPIIPPMLWKPHAALYPKLIVEAPGGLKVHEANSLRKRGLKIMRLHILSKNAYHGDLVQHVRDAFEDDELVRIDCKTLNTSDYKKIGAKLRDLVPCYLLSFEKEQIILWRGRDKIWPKKDLDKSEETANVQRIEDGGGSTPVVASRCEDRTSIESCCEDVEVAQANLNESSDEKANWHDTSDADAESSAFLEESAENVETIFPEESEEDAKSSAFEDSDEDAKSSAFSEESVEA